MLKDGEVIAATPVKGPLLVRPGTTIRVAAFGLPVKSTLVQCEIGTIIAPRRQLEACSRCSAWQDFSRLSEPDASVKVDGEPWAPFQRAAALVQGSHRLVIERTGFQRVERHLEIHPAGQERVQLTLIPTDEEAWRQIKRARSTRYWGYGASALGAALAISVGAYRWQATPGWDRAESNLKMVKHSFDLHQGGACDYSMEVDMAVCQARLNDAIDESNRANVLNVGSIAAISVGGAILLLGIILVAVGRSRWEDLYANDGKLSVGF